MDKFGIFNLLNSFLTPSTSSQDKNGDENSAQQEPKTDFISKLLSSISGEKQQSPSPAPSKQPAQTPTLGSNKSPTPPLQKQMLSTISTHDKIVNRIKNKS